MNSQTQILVAIGTALFVLGIVGFVTRRTLILMVLSLELMAVGVLVNLISFSIHHQDFGGQVLAVLVLTVAACEAAIALALFVSLYRRAPTLDSRAWRHLAEQRSTEPDEPLDDDSEAEAYPKLTPAGLDPLRHPQSLSPQAEDERDPTDDAFRKNRLPESNSGAAGHE